MEAPKAPDCARHHWPPGTVHLAPAGFHPLTVALLVPLATALAPGTVRAAQEERADPAPPPDTVFLRDSPPDSLAGSSVLEGRVLDLASGDPVPGALVVLAELGIALEAGAEGGFTFRRLRAGEHQILVRYTGRVFRPRSIEIVPAALHRVTVQLETDPVTLPELVVETERPERRGKMWEFDRRRRLHPSGQYIDREEIEERDPDRVSDLLYSVPGVNPVPAFGDLGSRTVTMGRSTRIPGRPACRVRYFLDGVRLPVEAGFRIDDLNPEEIEGIEIYRGLAEVPISLRRAGEDTCGVIAIWTRDPASARGR